MGVMTVRSSGERATGMHEYLCTEVSTGRPRCVDCLASAAGLDSIPPAYAVQLVGSYLGYGDTNAFGKAARDPKQASSAATVSRRRFAIAPRRGRFINSLLRHDKVDASIDERLCAFARCVDNRLLMDVEARIDEYGNARLAVEG
jgi:hypothetical protein